MKLNKASLRELINEEIKKELNEASGKITPLFEKILEQLGAEQLLDELFLSLDDSTAIESLKYIAQNHNIDTSESAEQESRIEDVGTIKESYYPQEWYGEVQSKWPSIVDYYIEQGGEQGEDRLSDFMDGIYEDLEGIKSFNDIESIKQHYSSGEWARFLQPIQKEVGEMINWMAQQLLNKKENV